MNNVDVGTYYQSGGSSSMPVNAPSGGNNAFILVASARNNDRVQFWWSTNAGKLFIRQTVSWSNGGSSDWSEWEAIALASNFIYKRGDTIPIERNYLMGTVLSNARIALFVPVSKPFASALPSSTITSADITVFDISYEGNARALKNNITQVSGWMRQNGIDMLVTFSELPSGLSVSSVVGIDFRGSITI